MLPVLRGYGEFKVNALHFAMPKPEVAKAFAKNMRAFHAAGGTGVKADGIAARQLHALREHYGGKLRLSDVKEMFVVMKDYD